MSDDYNVHSGRQSALWASLRHLFAAELSKLVVDPDRPTRVCDFGCSTGGNSLAPLRLVAAASRRRGGPLLWVTLSDLPGTDWRAAFRTVTPAAIAAAEPEAAEEAGAVQAADILVHAAPGSFYEQLMPPGTVDLSYALVATHWLSAVPHPPSPGVIHPGLESDPAILEAWRLQAQGDWQQFVAVRARELLPGGRLIVATIGRKEGTPYAPYNFSRTLARCMAEMVAAGALLESEMGSILTPVYYRTLTELAVPFKDPQVGLVVDTLEAVFSPCPYYLALQAKEITAEAYAAQLWSFVIGYSEAILRQALSPRGPAVADAVVADLQRRFTAAVAADPAYNRLDYTMVFVAAHKPAPGEPR
eukprot:EG_transcript_15042